PIKFLPVSGFVSVLNFEPSSSSFRRQYPFYLGLLSFAVQLPLESPVQGSPLTLESPDDLRHIAFHLLRYLLNQLLRQFLRNESFLVLHGNSHASAKFVPYVHAYLSQCSTRKNQHLIYRSIPGKTSAYQREGLSLL